MPINKANADYQKKIITKMLLPTKVPTALLRVIPVIVFE